MADAPAESSEAFQSLGNEVRTRVLTALLEDGSPVVRSFSDLYESSGVDTTAGFAYHLRKLTDRYLTEVEDGGYTLTYAGVQAARDITSGAYTKSFDRESVPIDDPCPFCGESSLAATANDNTVAVRCEDCERTLLRLPFPAGGFQTHDDDALPAAVDRLHRHRVGLMTAGSCPECGGASEATIERVPGALAGDETRTQTDGNDRGPVQLRLACAACAYTMRCPVTLAVIDHPAVVSFYYDHGVDVRERPIWNVGSEWRESVLSSDPWCVRVSTVFDDDGLELLVGRDGTVVSESRFTVGKAS